jgi:hypothetical protein
MSPVSSTTVAARLDRIPPIRMHRRMFLINLGIYSGFTLAAAFAPNLA